MKKRISIALSVIIAIIMACSSLAIFPKQVVAAETESESYLTITNQNIVLATGDSISLQTEGGSGEIIWESSDPTIVTVDGQGTVTAKTYGKAVIAAYSGDQVATAVVQTLYNDVLADSVSKGAYKAIYWAADMGITKGHGNVTFGPAETATRQQFAIFMWRLAGSPDTTLPAESPFSDITSATTGYKAIIWAVNNGIIKGYKDGTFKPANEVLRKEVVIMLWRFAGKPAANTALNFSDVSETSSAAPAIAWGSENGIVRGFEDGTFAPDNTCLRQEIAIFLYRYYNAYLNENPEAGFDALPAGTYTYAASDPEDGQLSFNYKTKTLFWSEDGEQKSVVLTGDELDFMNGLYISDRPLYDWLASNSRNTEGYQGNLDGYFQITLDDAGKISGLRADNGITNAVAILTADITADMLTVTGATRGQPNLLQSSVTLFGSCNGLTLADRGNVILNEISIGSDSTGVGLVGEKTGGDTFIVNTVTVDGEIHWESHYANIQPVLIDEPATLETLGQDIIIRGCNIGRLGREMNFVSNGGDIIIGETVSTDYGRGGMLADTSKGALTLSTTGNIDAGTGNVVIGTNTDRIVKIDMVGDIIGHNITIKPTDNGNKLGINSNIGDIKASGDINIELGDSNTSNDAAQVIGDITASGNINFTAEKINGSIGNIKADGDVKVTISSVNETGNIEGKTVDTDISLTDSSDKIMATPFTGRLIVGENSYDADIYTISDSHYIKIRDLAYVLVGTEKETHVDWYGTVGAIVTMTSGRDYTADGSEMAARANEEAAATSVSITIYLDAVQISVEVYKINDNFYFNLDDLAKSMNFQLTEAVDSISIDTSSSYTK